MKKVAYAAVLLAAMVAGAVAAEMGLVANSITYVAGTTRPLTLNTDGELRVECN